MYLAERYEDLIILSAGHAEGIFYSQVSERLQFARCEKYGDFEPEDFIDAIASEGSRMAGPLPKLGLVNIMPSKVYLKAEHQWRDALAGQVDIVPLRFDEDPRLESRPNIGKYAQPISEAADQLDGLIITGANLEIFEDGREFPMENIKYYRQLSEVIDWSVENNRLNIFSCLASHIALKYIFDIDRTIQLTKTFGVFDHDYDQSSSLTSGIEGATIKSPHSRWGSIDAKQLEDSGIDVLASSDDAGWLLSEYNTAGNRLVFLQGHPEYQRDDLRAEYLRDKSEIPKNYFTNGDPDGVPRYSWADDSRALFSAIGSIVSRQTV